jgi:acylphosphatase
MVMSPQKSGRPPGSGRLHAVVQGRVQGVNFRYYTQQCAAELGLDGWVANLDDGSVEVVAEGSSHALAELLAFLQTGPSLARVENVDLHWEKATGEFSGFRARYL